MALIPIRVGDGVEGADDCTIVITRPIVETEKPAAERMMDDAEALAEALEKYLPAMTLTRLEQILTRKREPKTETATVARQAGKNEIGRKLVEALKVADSELRQALGVAASADRGYDTLSCGHVVTRFAIEGGAQVPCVLAATPSDLAWCGWHGWIKVDVQQYRELVREIREAMP